MEVWVWIPNTPKGIRFCTFKHSIQLDMSVPNVHYSLFNFRTTKYSIEILLCEDMGYEYILTGKGLYVYINGPPPVDTLLSFLS